MAPRVKCTCHWAAGSETVNILFLGMNYSPEPTGIGPLTTDLCEHLALQGHEVSVVTAVPHYPEWAIYPDYRGKVFVKEQRNGVTLRRGYVHLPKNSTTIQRIAYDTSICFSALYWGLMSRKVDVIFAISPPLQLGVVGCLLSQIKRSVFVFQVQDLALDAGMALGMLKNNAIIRVARASESLIYRRAQSIFVIGNGLFESLRKRGVSESKIKVLSNWVDTDIIRPLERNNAFRQQHGLVGKLVALHAGNIGAKQDLGNVIHAASLLARRRELVFMLVGEGSQKAALKEMVAELNLENVRFLPLQPKESLSEMFSAADVLLLNQVPGLADVVLPSKLLTYMAAGRPIIASIDPDSESANYVRKAECGLVILPQKPDLLAKAITRVVDSPSSIKLGEKARAFAEKNFARRYILTQYDAYFRNLRREKR